MARNDVAAKLATPSPLGVALTAEEWGEVFMLLAAVAWADGGIEDSEVMRLRALAKAYRVATVKQVAYVLENPISKAEFSALGKRKRVAKFAIREAVSMALVDGYFSDAERVVIGKACSDLGIPQDFASKAEAWCRELMLILEKGRSLVDDD